MSERNRCMYPKKYKEQTTMTPDEYIKYIASISGNIYSWSIRDLTQFSTDVDSLAFLPFREEECQRVSTCCGLCTKRCSKRCVHDLLNRCNVMYMQCKAAQNWGSATLATRLLMKQLEASSEKVPTYANLCALVGAYLNDDPTLTRDMHKWNYAQTYHMVPAKKNANKLVKAFDPDTGAYLLNQWPESGQCPFCTPRSLVTRQGGVKKLI